MDEEPDPTGHNDVPNKNVRHSKPNPDCPICKGTGFIEEIKRYQLGNENTPEEYVKKLIKVFRAVRRVLRDDGTLWLNLGDTYATTPAGNKFPSFGKEFDGRDMSGIVTSGKKNKLKDSGLKPKDLVGIPWRVAFALQKDGWYLRRDIIWEKRNPMPESCTDRCTTSHEYIFMLTKNSKYYYDNEAIREKYEKPLNRWGGDIKEPSPIDSKVWSEEANGYNSKSLATRTSECRPNPAGRNCRSVWTITVKPYKGAHFATFPEEIPERCIKAGTSEKGCCAKCGAPYERIIERIRPSGWKDEGPKTDKEKELREISKEIYGGNQKSRSISDIYGRATNSEIVERGWRPTCECGKTEIAPCIVLDPFAGSGTTGAVAQRLGRDAILIELNPLYIELIRKRLGYITESLRDYDGKV